MKTKNPFKLIPHNQIVQDDSMNVRKGMDAQALQDLKASIRQHGIRNPLEIEILETGENRVVTGNRRHSATKLLLDELELERQTLVEDAGADSAAVLEIDRLIYSREAEIPVRILTTEEAQKARELQLIENLIRDDLSPVEEAEGYQWLVKNKQDTPKSIAEKIGRSSETVRQRLKLLQAGKPMLSALDKGLVGSYHCYLVGRIPSDQDRARASRMILDPKLQDEPLNVRQAQELITKEFMVSLQKASFDLEDETLISDVGPCSSCEFMTGNNPDLTAELSSGPAGATGGRRSGVAADVCTNPSCFRSKVEAAMQLQADEQGVDLLDEDEAARVFGGHGGTVAFDSPFVDVSARPTERDTGHFNHDRVPTWKQLTKDLEIPSVIARNPVTGRTHRLVDRSLAIDAVNAKCKAEQKPSPFEKTPQGEETKREKARQQREEQREREDFGVLALDGLVTAVATSDIPAATTVLALLGVVLEESSDAAFMLAKWRGIPEPKGGTLASAIVQDLRENLGPAEKQLEIGIAYLTGALLAQGLRWEGVKCPHFESFGETFGVRLQHSEGGA